MSPVWAIHLSDHPPGGARGQAIAQLPVGLFG